MRRMMRFISCWSEIKEFELVSRSSGISFHSRRPTTNREKGIVQQSRFLLDPQDEGRVGSEERGMATEEHGTRSEEWQLRSTEQGVTSGD